MNDGGPAFSQTLSDAQHAQGDVMPFVITSLRDWFAGEAMNGWMSDPNVTGEGRDVKQFIATESYAMADAMLAARETGDKDK